MSRLFFCKRPTWAISISGPSKLLAFSGLAQTLSNFTSICSYFSNVLVFNIWLLNVEQEKNERGNIKELSSFKCPGTHFNQKVRNLQCWAEVPQQWLLSSLFVPLWWGPAISCQSPSPWHQPTGSFQLFIRSFKISHVRLSFDRQLLLVIRDCSLISR